MTLYDSLFLVRTVDQNTIFLSGIENLHQLFLEKRKSEAHKGT